MNLNDLVLWALSQRYTITMDSSWSGECQYPQGFHLWFEDGSWVSIQAGPANYCENRSFSFHECRAWLKINNAEVWGAMPTEDTWFNNDPFGWVDAEWIKELIILHDKHVKTGERVSLWWDENEYTLG